MSTLQSILKPTSIVVAQNVNYTVPAGRIAKVNVSMAVSNAFYINPGPSVSSSTYSAGNNAAAVTKQLTLRAGDVVSSTRSTGAGTTNVGAGVSNVNVTRVAVASISLLINGANSSLIQVQGAGGGRFSNGNSFASESALTSIGSADVGLVVEEYLE
jgi:hypothetical protein